MDLAPFATSSDLATRLGVTYTVAEAARVDELLADACAELRGMIGQPLTRLTSTVTLYADEYGKIVLPALPVISVASALVDGTAVEWTLRDDVLALTDGPVGDDPVVVTYTHGWDPVPRELVKFACVMAAAALQGSEHTGALGPVAGVGRRQESIDDYTVITDAPVQSQLAAEAMTLPEPIIARLRADYNPRGRMYWVKGG